MDADYGRREKKGKKAEGRREREAPGEEKELMLMWKRNETDEGETGGNKGGQETRREEKRQRVFLFPLSLALCLHGCDATLRQPVL